MKRQLFGALGLAFSFALLGCGSSGGDSAATQASCDAYCSAYIAATCDPSNYVSVSDCETNECGGLSAAPSNCQATIKAYYDCEKTQADICGDTGCDPQFAALASCQ